MRSCIKGLRHYEDRESLQYTIQVFYFLFICLFFSYNICNLNDALCPLEDTEVTVHLQSAGFRLTVDT